MRAIGLLLLLATAAPAGALDDPTRSWRAERRAPRAIESPAQPGPSDQAEARPQMRQRWRSPGGPLVETREPRVEPGEVAVRPAELGRRGGQLDAGRDEMPSSSATDSLLPSDAPRGDDLDSVRTWRSDERRQLRDVRVRTRPGSRPSAVITPPPGARPDLQAPAPVRAVKHADTRTWHRDWRGDRRYDWRRHRERNRWPFRLGFYHDPFGWSYRRYPIGWRLWPSYYDHHRWLQDPWRFHLPPAYGRYRWVRYWDDALLVDIYSGQVVDVIHNVFW